MRGNSQNVLPPGYSFRDGSLLKLAVISPILDRQEINFHCLLALLSFGGSHEPALVRSTGTTVEDSVKFGLIGAHLGRQGYGVKRFYMSLLIVELLGSPLRPCSLCFVPVPIQP